MNNTVEKTTKIFYTLKKIMPNIEDDIRNNYVKQHAQNQIKGR